MIELALGRARVSFTDRHGGVSSPPYDTLNLADHVGDAARDVATNRQALVDLVGRSPGLGAYTWLHQLHGAAVVEVGRQPLQPAPGADAAITAHPERPLVVLTADCAPVALAADDAVGVVHAGWRGLEAGIIAAAVDALSGIGSGPIRAVLGPCIRSDHYEFGEAALDRLVDRFGAAVRSTTSRGTPAFDLPQAVRIALAERGVEVLDDVALCTACSPDHFSHRREGVTGRQALVVWMEP